MHKVLQKSIRATREKKMKEGRFVFFIIHFKEKSQNLKITSKIMSRKNSNISLVHQSLQCNSIGFGSYATAYHITCFHIWTFPQHFNLILYFELPLSFSFPWVCLHATLHRAFLLLHIYWLSYPFLRSITGAADDQALQWITFTISGHLASTVIDLPDNSHVSVR